MRSLTAGGAPARRPAPRAASGPEAPAAPGDDTRARPRGGEPAAERRYEERRPEAASRAVKVDVRGFSFCYGERRALDGIDLAMHANQITAIIGPSGCGKSTLVKSINRIAEVAGDVRTEGRIVLDGVDVYDPAVDVVDLRRRVGMVFQKPNPFPKSIYDNVAFGPRLHGAPGPVRLDEIVERSLVQAALWKEVKDRLRDSALALSGGQQQRLCIARVLAVDPDVVLLDEPCSALDPTGTAKIEETLLDLKSQYTLVIVTHNMQQAARVSDRTAFLLEGRLIEVGDTHQIFTTPANSLTEDYITGRFG